MQRIPSGDSGNPNGHLREITDILALGLLRLHARKSSRNSPQTGESSLHFSAAESGDPARIGRENRE
jgi:hypothetical protein